MRVASLCAATLLLSSAPTLAARAQQATAVVPGTRVRLLTVGREPPLVGEVRHLAGDTLILSLSASRGQPAVDLIVPPSQVRALFVSRDRRGRGSRAARGLLIGAAIGVGLGLVISDETFCDACEDTHVLSTVLLAPAGAVIGLVVGAAQSERWRRVEWPPTPRAG